MVKVPMAHTVSLEAIKALRETTSASMNDVRKALEVAAVTCSAPSYGASVCHCQTKALEELRARGVEIAKKREGRTTGQGRIETYIHHDGRLAAMVEVNCETDFVARTPDFQQFCRDVVMQVAAMNPRYVKPDEMPAKEREDGAALQASCLLEQPFVKDQGVTVGDLLQALIAKTGENVVIRRFTRFAVGDTETQKA